MLRHPLLIIAPVALGLAATAGVTLSTKYVQERTLRIEATTKVEMETTSMTMLRDGEPMEGRGGGAGAISTDERTIVQLDTVLAGSDDAPTKVRRVYESVEGTSSRTFGDREMDSEVESPFNGVELLLTDDDGDVVVEVEDGDEPDPELLEGHRLELASDALLPDGEVAVDDEWELDAETIQRVLGLDLQAKLFPPMMRSEEEGGARGERGGRRGGFGRRGGGSSVLRLLASDEWEGTATLTAESEETDYGTGAVIEFKAECEGDLPEPPARGGRGGRGGGGGFLFAGLPVPAPISLPENTFTVELEGRLVVSADEGRPLYLEVEGEVTIETFREFGRGDVEMSMESLQEGTFTYVVKVSVAEKDE